MPDWLSHTLSSLFGSRYVQTWLGALSCHMLSLYNKGFTGTTQFLKGIIPNKSQSFYSRWDAVILPLIGALVAFSLLDPTSLKQAMWDGISWSISLIAFVKKTNNTPTKS